MAAACRQAATATSSLLTGDRFGFPGYVWLRGQQFVVDTAALHGFEGNAGRELYGVDHRHFRKLKPPSYTDRHRPVTSKKRKRRDSRLSLRV
ncbi:MAG TPA: hypothetical protein VFF50_09480 [Candidatus Deferrimicrobiaceae bacterium]|nr:hypothetical protein [Candidatus Deferrimicrobiaceae bacterium]